MSVAMKRRDLLIRLGLLAGGLGGAWWVRDHLLWPAPGLDYADGAGTTGWLPYVAHASTPTVAVRVAGREVAALIDSGAQYSVIDRALVASLTDAGADLPVFEIPMVAFGVGGQPQVGRGVTLDVGVGTLRLKRLRTAVLNLGPLASPEGLGAPLILGQDVLRLLTLDLDTERRRLRLSRSHAHAPAADLHALETRLMGGALSLMVEVEGRPLEAVIDTGASALLSLSQEAATEAGLLDGRPARPGSSIVLGGAIASTVVEAANITIGGTVHRAAQVPIYADVRLPGFPRALVGMGAFEGRRVRLDLGAGDLSVSRLLEVTVV